VWGASQGEIIGTALVVFLVAALALLGSTLGRSRRARPPSAAARRHAPPELKTIIETARAGIEALARQHAEIVFTTWIGAVEIDPKHLAFWIFTRTDAERDRLASNDRLLEEFREIAAVAGYPPPAVPQIKFAFESKETVDRDWDGNYWYAMR
jgi:hypothetical protein